jgi:predicted helicase
MRPGPFLNGDLVSLRECFIFCRSGLQTKRDHFVYDASSAMLTDRVKIFLILEAKEAERVFHNTRDRTWAKAKSIPFSTSDIAPVAYRPLDKRFLYNHPAYGDFLRPELQAVWGDGNIGLYAMPGGTGKGPAVWCHGLLPDYHAFSGRGGYAFPLHDRRPHVAAPNVSSALIQGLSMVYGEPVDPGRVFAAILCLLSAASYTLRFAEDLEDVFPHVPFPARQAAFQEAVRIGREIRAVETFSRKPNATYLEPPFARLVSEPQGFVVAGRYGEGEITLGTEQTGRIAGIPHAVWDFKVSGYQVVWRWLKGREGLPADLGFVREFRDICARVAELLDLYRS